MGLAILDEHEHLARTIRVFLGNHDALAAARAAADGGATTPDFWSDMAGLGWLGLHVPEEDGGSGFGTLELAVVAAELGRVCCPGPFLPTVVAAGAIATRGSSKQRASLLPRLVSGELSVGLGLHGDLRRRDNRTVDGDAGPVLCGGTADLLVLADGEDLVVLDRDDPHIHVEARANLDPTRPCAPVRLDDVVVPPERRIPAGAGRARWLLSVLTAAEAAGGAAACREMATEYAKVRTAFGRPIGQFQAIKHHCANMLVDEELATAAAWQAAIDDSGEHSASVLTALATSLAAFVRCAKLNIQVHGGIGFTWEHDAHLFLRRATALAALAGPVDRLLTDLATHDSPAEGGTWSITLPMQAQRFRTETRAFRDAYEAAPQPDRHRLVVDHGYLFPHWPRPWGRGAGAVEQLVIEQELGDLSHRAHLGPTWWTLPIVLPTIIAHGTDDQKDRWVRPTMEGRLAWCQLFSEPGAGSDLAALSTRAAPIDGGWAVTGQKVWTSSAHQADLGFALVRTDPQTPKHRGITCMIIDMRAAGVTIRPLRQLTGHAEFNEVFLDEVFVPDESVVGEVNGGWAVARTTLGNERVSLGSGGWGQDAAWRTIRTMAQQAGARDPILLQTLGELVAVSSALEAMNLRSVLRAVEGTANSHEGAVTKLVASEHTQRVADLGVRVIERAALYLDGEHGDLVLLYLASRSMTIAGGTSEIGRNMIAERVLGLPRDPMP